MREPEIGDLVILRWGEPVLVVRGFVYGIFVFFEGLSGLGQPCQHRAVPSQKTHRIRRFTTNLEGLGVVSTHRWGDPDLD